MSASPRLPFAKMHGCGNDYVVVDGFAHAIADPGPLARSMAERRYGVGSDGFLLALPSEVADFRMQMFNADGSEAEMCGNGLRCLVKFVLERNLVAWSAKGRVETGAGILGYEIDEASRHAGVSEVEIDMGRPVLERSALPMLGPEGRVIEEALEVGEAQLSITGVSMGNPHVVTWVDDVAACPVVSTGPLVEHHDAFPRRTNIEFVEVLSPHEVRQRTWERGCGETLACGTGACAVVVAGVLTGRLERDVRVHLRGGDLQVTWQDGGPVRMRGPAIEVFEGFWPRR